MNYFKIYQNLVIKAQSRNSLSGYVEIHHIIPRSMGGSDIDSNLVKMTAREHFVAHLLLAKMYGGPMLTALWYMTNKSKGSLGSRTYSWLKEENAERMSIILSGKTKSPEHLAKISESLKVSERAREQREANHEAMRGKSNSHKGQQQNPEWIEKRVSKLKGQSRSDETKEKMGAWIRTTETKDKIRKSRIGKSSGMKGKRHDSETLQKMSDAAKGKPWSEARRAAYLNKRNEIK